MRTGHGKRFLGRHTVIALAAILSLISCCGCGTVSTRTKGLRAPYSGLGADVEKLASLDEWGDVSSLHGNAGDVPFPLPRALVWVADAPLSFIADTLLLPVDLLWPPAPRPNEWDIVAGSAEP